MTMEIFNAAATEAGAVAELAVTGMTPKTLLPGTVYATPDGKGGVRIVSTDDYSEHPRSATANRVVTDAESFNRYLQKHAGANGEIWADQPGNTIVGIVDAHAGLGAEPGWEKHRVTLSLEKTKAWLAWEKLDRVLMSQVDFADFIEDRANDVYDPSPAELIALARRFQASKSVKFESGQREKDGETTLEFVETVTAKAGQKGQIAIPDRIKLGLKPYVGGPTIWVWARFVYRLNGAELKLGYILERPEVILESAFADILALVRDGRPEVQASPVTETGPAVYFQSGFDGVTQPIFNGRPGK